MKRLFSLFAALSLAMVAFAQNQGSVWKPVYTIAEVGVTDDKVRLSMFDCPDEDGRHHYYMNVGKLGVGDDIVQFYLDPVFQLFIPLGDTLEDAQTKLEELKAVADKPTGEGFEMPGTLALANPSTGEYETVYVTSRHNFLQRLVKFSVKRDGYLRSNYVAKSDIAAIINTLKIYRKIHPKEQ